MDDAVRQAAAMMGSVRSPAKTEAARRNALLGGRKKGTPQTAETRDKIREGKLRYEAEKRQAAGIVEQPAAVKRPRGRPRKVVPEKEG